MTPKQLAFARNYATNPDAYRAMKDAGYSEHYAKTKAKVILANTEVIAEIQRLRQRMNERAEKSATDVVNEYSKIAFTDRTGFMKPDPDFPGCYMYKSPDELTDEQRALVEKVTASWRKVERVINGEKIRVDRQEFNYLLSDKANALQQMGRHFGIFDDKLRLTTPNSNPFKNATPAQLEALKKAWVKTMNDQRLIEGDYERIENK